MILATAIMGLILPFRAHSAEEPDFSLFRDPNEAMSSADQSKTEAEPSCISCLKSPPTPKNQLDHQKVIKKLQNLENQAQAPQKKEPECITCNRVHLTKSPSVNGDQIWRKFPQISAYSEHPEVKAMIRYAESHAHRASRGMCYRYVKEALCRSPRGKRCKGGSLVGNYLNGTPVFPEVPSRSNPKIGPNAIRNLKKQDFINLLEDPTFSSIVQNPASAPKGAIMIYQGGKNGGHIEIKTGHGANGSYISDFKAPNSIMKNELAGRASKNYKLVGVMVKPAEKLK